MAKMGERAERTVGDIADDVIRVLLRITELPRSPAVVKAHRLLDICARILAREALREYQERQNEAEALSEVLRA